MSFIEKLSNHMAERIAAVLKFDKDHEAVLAYGAFSVLQTIWSIALVVIFGMLFHVLKEVLIISVTGAVLRKYSGGAHATSPNRCAVIGLIATGGLALLVNRVMVNAHWMLVGIYVVISFMFAYMIIARYAPVDTPNKPIKKDERRQKLREKSINMIFISLVFIVGFFILYMQFNNENLLISGMSICTGLLWQAFTLTDSGHLAIDKIDKFLNFSNQKGV